MHFVSRRGFTLLELSIVLIIIALVTGMAVSSGVSVIAQARYTATQKKMAGIETALMQYRTANDRLPCPADITLATSNANYGLEAANPGTCTGGTPAADYTGTGITNTNTSAAEGAVPILTLGLPNDYMFDGWGNRFRYAVDVNFTAYGAFTNMPVGCTTAAITINDLIGTRSTSSVYALISHGANGFGAFPKVGGSNAAATLVNTNSDNTNEDINCHCASTSGTMALNTYTPKYVQMPLSYSATDKYNNFDDLVSYKERWQLQTPWDTLGSCSYVFVTDTTSQKIYKYDINGNYITSFGGAGTGDGQFSTSGSGADGTGFPGGIGATPTGNLWVVDNNRLESFDINGNYLNQFPYTNIFNSSNAIAVDSSGYIWLADYNAQEVLKYSAFGNKMLAISACGVCYSSNAGDFNGPEFSAVDHNGNIWVADRFNYRIEKFNSSGVYLNQVSLSSLSLEPMGIAITAGNQILVGGAYGGIAQCTNTSGLNYTCTTLISTIGRPRGIAVAPNGNIFAVNSVNSGAPEIKVYNSSGTFIKNFGISQLGSPWGIAITSR